MTYLLCVHGAIVLLQVGLMSSDLVSIGEVARRSGRAASAIRYWLEDAARCLCSTLDDCALFDPGRLPEPLSAH